VVCRCDRDRGRAVEAEVAQVDGRVGAAEFGTYFIGYVRRPEVIEQMLENMFIGKPPGNIDRILDFSTAVTDGSLAIGSLKGSAR